MVSSGTVDADDNMAASIDVVAPSNAGESTMPTDVVSDSEVKTIERVVVAKQISTKESRTPGATAPSAASNSYIMQEEISGNMQILKKKESKSLNSPIELYQNKKYAEALNGFDAMIQQNNADESALFYKGMCLYHLQRFREASAVLEVVGKNRNLSYSDEALYHAALSFEKSGDLTSAGNILETLAAGTGSFKQKAAKRLKQLNR
jgi:tetratricopeptide (TPR) repeat protein